METEDTGTCEECGESFTEGSGHFTQIQKKGFCKECWMAWKEEAKEHRDWEEIDYPRNTDIDKR